MANERQQFLGLPETVEIEIKHAESSGEHEAVQHVEEQSVAQQCADVAVAFLAVEGAYERGEAVGEAEAAEDDDVEHAVDKRR